MIGNPSPHEQITDEEAAFWRHFEFGELPPRVRPEDRVELEEADCRLDVLPEPEDGWWSYG